MNGTRWVIILLIAAVTTMSLGWKGFGYILLACAGFVVWLMEIDLER